MNQRFNKGAQGGFTLIELIVVIVILGILAATALPKFANLSGDARKASLQAARGSMASAASMAHGKWLITPTTTKIENTDVTFANGYPNALTIAPLAGITDIDYDVVTTGTSTKIHPKNLTAAQKLKCFVQYTEAGTGAAPGYTQDFETCE